MTEQQPQNARAILAQIAREVGPIGKDERNAQQGFNFRGIETVLGRVGPMMAQLGMVPMPRVIDRTVEQVPIGNQGKTWRLVSLTVEYHFLAPDGSEEVAVTVGEGSDPGDKAASKALSMAYKYALTEVLMIAGQHDDPDAAEGPPREEDAPQRAARPSAAPRKAAAKKGPSKTPSKRPSQPAEKGPDYESAPVREANPPAPPADAKVTENDPRRTWVIEAINGLTDEGYRTECKTKFVSTFGVPPHELPDDQLDAAQQAVADMLDSEPF